MPFIKHRPFSEYYNKVMERFYAFSNAILVITCSNTGLYTLSSIVTFTPSQVKHFAPRYQAAKFPLWSRNRFSPVSWLWPIRRGCTKRSQVRVKSSIDVLMFFQGRRIQFKHREHSAAGVIVHKFAVFVRHKRSVWEPLAPVLGVLDRRKSFWRAISKIRKSMFGPQAFVL